MKSKRDHLNFRLALAIVTIIAGLTSTLAQSQSDDSARDDSGKGTIKGRVVNESGQPLPNAVIRAYGYGGGAQEKYTITDNEGNFQLTGLASIAWIISASLPTYVLAPRDPDVNPVGYYRVGDSVRLEMKKGGVITGSVKRSNDEPLASMLVQAFMIRDFKGKPPPISLSVRSAVTDDRGIYRLYGLEPGTYVVCAGGGTGNGYAVDAYAGGAPTFAPASPRETATEISVSAGEEAANVDIRYREEPGHTVSGTAAISGPADPQRNVVVTMSSSGLSPVTNSVYQTPGMPGFSFNGVADGDYELVAQSFWPGTDLMISETRRIRVKDADVAGIELIAKPLGSISGSVVLEESKAPDCAGKRRLLLAETVISAWHNEKKVDATLPRFVWSLGTPITPNEQGSFVLHSLAAGEYRINVRPMARYWYLKSIAWPPTSKAMQVNQPLDAARNWTTLKVGDHPSGLTITFAAGAASLQGRIETGEGQTLPSRLFVYLTPVEPDKAEDVLRYFVSLAREDGSFALSNVPPGRYWVIAKLPREGETNLFVNLRLPDQTEARARLLREGEGTKVAVDLKPCQNLSDYRLPFRPASQ
jgi:Carboxypeptidase regulatory-like domain